MRMLADEAALREGPVPAGLDDPLLVTPLFQIADDSFLLALPNGLRFHYRRGAGVTFSRGADIADAEVELFHHGSVHGAVAWLIGLAPLHASAIVHGGRVHAFTGHSGAGKSMLGAALGQRGLPLFADDVLVLDLSDPAQPIAIPGHKRLKLWAEGLAITGLDRGAAIRDGIDKYFVAPPALDQAPPPTPPAPLPLASLTFLDQPSGRDPSLAAVRGAQRFNRMRAAFYRPRYAEALLRPRETFALAARLAAQIPLYVFDRPRDRDRFDANVDFLAAAIRAGAL